MSTSIPTLLENAFSFQETSIRIAVSPDGQTWFCAKDIFTALDIEWRGATSLVNTPEDWVTVRYLRTIKGERPTIFLSEPAVYQTIFRSQKEQAKAFAHWVCAEVLPSIRKTGYYGVLPVEKQMAARRILLSSITQLKASRDLFETELLVQQVRDLCNQLGMKTPDLAKLGKDPKQIALPGLEVQPS